MTAEHDPNQNREHSNICDYCRESFQCGRLLTALKVIAGDEERLKSDPQLSRAYERVKAILTRSGWNYPDGNISCDLVHSSDLIAQMTSDLVRLFGRDVKKAAQ